MSPAALETSTNMCDVVFRRQSSAAPNSINSNYMSAFNWKFRDSTQRRLCHYGAVLYFTINHIRSHRLLDLV